MLRGRFVMYAVIGWCTWTVAATQAAETSEHFDSESSIKTWTFSNGPEFPGAGGTIEWNSTEGHASPGCLVLKHSFVGGGRYVQATGLVPGGVDARVARVWLKKPGAHRISFRAIDQAGQCFQKGIEYVCPDWQQIEVDLDQWGSHWGGPNDGKLRRPIRQFAVVVENSTVPKEGTLLVDDVEFLPEPAGAGANVTYTAVDFANAGGWHVSGGPGNALDRGAWSYRFNAGSPPTISTDFSLLGEPVSMRLVLDGDGSGHGVRLDLGSHFQSFHRRIGALAAKGEQVIETPLGKLEGWGHYGGEDNGIARQPLRLRRISLERSSGAADSGTLILKRVEVVTRPRDGQAVVLVPTVSGEAPDVRFSVRAINLRPTAVEGRLWCDVCGLAGTNQRHETALSLAANGQPVEWDVAHQLQSGEYFAEAVFQWADGEFVSKPVSVGTSVNPFPPDDRSAELDPASIIGAGLYLYRWRGVPNYQQRAAEVAALARHAGVKWTREEIQWAATEPVQGRFDWQFYDDIFAVARANGISVYGLLAYWSDWADKNTPKGVEQYCAWARQVVRRYNDRIKHWEVWNEPNIFFWSGPRELYADLLKQAYAAIKAEDPDAVVMGCSTAGIDTDFIRKVIGWGGRFDALTIHPYRGVMDDLQFMQELRDVRRLVDDREVWLTEIGFPSQLVDGRSERQQASLVARVYLCTAASGAARNVSWYDFRNDGVDPFYNEMNFGLVRHDLRPKPGYTALAMLGRTIGHMRLAGPVDAGPDTYGFRFTDGKTDVVAVCSPEKGRVFTAAMPKDVQIRDTFGESIRPVWQNGMASVTSDAGFPVYFAGRPGFEFKPAKAAISCSIEPAAVRAGRMVTCHLESESPMTIGVWDVPPGWPTPRRLDDRTWQIAVPPTAPAWEYDLHAQIEGASLRLPIRIAVTPIVIRT
ncbi:MAG: beta-galactosidase [Planctomycetes bacterium]|nr:beta-galactosidase [Planctomycetota bacterium]